MIRTWKITQTKSDELQFDNSSSLDAITRQLVPDGFYSTFRTYDGCTRVIGLSAHLKRLPNVDASALRRNLIQLLEPFRPDEARVRVLMNRSGDMYIAIEPLKLLPREVYEIGVNVETTALHRDDPRVKSTSFIGASDSERKHLAQEKIFEALLVKNGMILEGMTSNFFYIPRAERSVLRLRSSQLTLLTPLRTEEDMQGAQSKRAQREVLCTARNDILLGITRTMVIRAARGRGVSVKYSPLKLNQLSLVKEAFITSSSRGVVPVIQIDDVIVGEGRVGLVTKMLMSAYEEHVMSHAEAIL